VQLAQLAQLAQLVQLAQLANEEKMNEFYLNILRQLGLDSSDSGQRLDADVVQNSTLFLERELTQFRDRLFEVQYLELKAQQFIPIATDIDPLLDTYEYYVTDYSGQARIIAKGATDIPQVSLGTKAANGKVVTLGLGYGFDIDEMRLAVRLRKPLESRLAEATRKGHLVSIDELLRTGKLASTGQVANDLGGFLNCPDVPCTGDSGAPTLHAWLSVGSTPTNIQVYQDMVNLAARPQIRTKGIYVADTMLLASPLYQYVASTPMFTTGSETTILSYFLRNSTNIKNVSQWISLDNSGDGTIGTASYHQIVVYKRDKACLEGVVPVDFEQFPPEVRGFRTQVKCRSKCGGVKWYVPDSAEYGFISNSTT
jgi:hypothetical protein